MNIPFRYLTKSRVVRKAFAKEIMRLAIYIVTYLGARAFVRYLEHEPVFEGNLTVAVICFSILIAWFFSVIKTLKTVMREEGDAGVSAHRVGKNC